MILFALTVSAALAQSAPAVIETPREYVECLTTASKEVALEYEDVDDAMPRVMAKCEAVWDRFEQRTLQRHPNGAGTLADLKSRMREQVREAYAANSTNIQKRSFMRGLAEGRKMDQRFLKLQSLVRMYVDCQRAAAREALENGMKSEAIGNHADKKCGEYEADAAKLAPRVLAESVVVGSDVPQAKIDAYVRKSAEQMLDSMRKYGRQASASVIAEAKRWETCTAKGNGADICELHEQIFRATAVHKRCVGTSAMRSAADGDSLKEALADVDKACGEEWLAVEKLSKAIGDSDQARNSYVTSLVTLFERDYPKLLEQARNAGSGSQ